MQSPAIYQSAEGGNDLPLGTIGGTGSQFTFAKPNIEGNLLLVQCMSTGGTTTPTDSAGNSYTAVVTDAGTTGNAGIWWAIAKAWPAGNVVSFPNQGFDCAGSGIEVTNPSGAAPTFATQSGVNGSSTALAIGSLSVVLQPTVGTYGWAIALIEILAGSGGAVFGALPVAFIDVTAQNVANVRMQNPIPGPQVFEVGQDVTIAGTGIAGIDGTHTVTFVPDLSTGENEIAFQFDTLAAAQTITTGTVTGARVASTALAPLFLLMAASYGWNNSFSQDAAPDGWTTDITAYTGGGSGTGNGDCPIFYYTPQYETTLASVIEDICERSGLDSSEIDVSLLNSTNLQPTELVLGYLIEKPTPADSILKPLMLTYFVDACESDGVIKFVPRGLAPQSLAIPEADLGLVKDAKKLLAKVGQAWDLPLRYVVNYNDPTLNFQKNKQEKIRNSRIVASKQQVIVDIPMTMTADWAIQVAEKLLYQAWIERDPVQFNLWKAIYALFDPTDVVQFVYSGITFQARIVKNTCGAGLAIELRVVPAYEEILQSSATGGQSLAPSTGGLQILAPATLFLFDIPLLQDTDGNPQNTGFYWGLSSAVPSFSSGVLLESGDDVNFSQEDATAQPLTFGYATGALGAPRSPWTWDRANTLTVNPVRGAFTGDTPLNVLNGSNAVLVGNPATGKFEIIQYANSVENSDGSFTLSMLTRGRRGTEWCCGTHAAGDLVVLLPSGIQREQQPLAIVNQENYYKGVTSGQDPTTVPAETFAVEGQDLMPYAPAQIAGSRGGGGDLTIDWIRRTRVGWMNLSQDPVPLSEDSEQYSIDILDSMGHVKRTINATSPTASYTAAQQVADFGSAQSSIAMNIYQVSAQIGRGFAAGATL